MNLLTRVPPLPCALQVGQSLLALWDGPGHLWKYVPLVLPAPLCCLPRSPSSERPDSNCLVWADLGHHLELQGPSLLYLLPLATVLGQEHWSWLPGEGSEV